MTKKITSTLLDISLPGGGNNECTAVSYYLSECHKYSAQIDAGVIITLQHPNDIQSFHSSCKLTDLDVIPIYKAFGKYGHHLRILDFSDCDLSANGVFSIVQFCLSLEIEDINFARNNIGT